MVRVWPILIAAAGCGRFDFGSVETAGDDGAIGHPDAASLIGCDTTHPTALLCEGFEPSDVAWDYQVVAHGSAMRSTARAVRGTASFTAKTDDANDYKYARWGKNYVLPDITSGELYLREWFWMTSATVIDDQLSILVTGNFADPYPSANVMLKPGEIHVVVEGDSYIEPFEFPRDRWACVELHLGVSDTTGTIDLAIDGTSIVTASGDTAVAGGYTNVDVGVHYATPGQSPAQIWIDEVVADTQPIGCD